MIHTGNLFHHRISQQRNHPIVQVPIQKKKNLTVATKQSIEILIINIYSIYTYPTVQLPS